MDRIVGAIAPPGFDVVPHLISALINQNYSAEAGCGIAVFDNDFVSQMDTGVAINVFSELRKDLVGSLAVGHNASNADHLQPHVCNLDLAVAYVIDSNWTTCEQITGILADEGDLFRGIKKALREIFIPFAIIAIDEDHQLIAARNAGRKPLSYGVFGDGACGHYFASQSGVIPSGQFVTSVHPGEMVVTNNNGPKRYAARPRPDVTRCSMEVMDIQRPDNVCGDREIYSIKVDAGRRLGEIFNQNLGKVDRSEFQALSINEGGREIGIGFAQTSGIATDVAGIAKLIYSVPPHAKEMAQKLGRYRNFHYSPVESLVKGKRVVLVENRLKWMVSSDICQMCLGLGAKEVQLVSAVIPRRECQHGTDFGRGDFIESNGVLIQEQLNLTQLLTLSPDELVETMNIPHRLFCTDCLRRC